MADHNDPNAVNSIFSDIDVSAADVYDLFGLPEQRPKRRRARGHRAHVRVGADDGRLRHRHALPPPGHDGAAGRLARARPRPRCAPRLRRRREGQVPGRPAPGGGARDRRCRAAREGRLPELPRRQLLGHVDLDTAVTEKAPDGQRDQALLRRPRRRLLQRPARVLPVDQLRAPVLPRAPHAAGLRELPIPKTLLELEGNDLFNFDPDNPAPRPRREARPAAGPLTWDGRHASEGRQRQLPVRLQRRATRRRAGTSTRSSSSCRCAISPGRPRTTASSMPGARAGCGRRRTRSRRSPTTRSGSSIRWRCSTPSSSTTS